jgi:hypothetical protein
VTRITKKPLWAVESFEIFLIKHEGRQPGASYSPRAIRSCWRLTPRMPTPHQQQGRSGSGAITWPGATAPRKTRGGIRHLIPPHGVGGRTGRIHGELGRRHLQESTFLPAWTLDVLEGLDALARRGEGGVEARHGASLVVGGWDAPQGPVTALQAAQPIVSGGEFKSH